jgi:GT2 family glycosyltransferase
VNPHEIDVIIPNWNGARFLPRILSDLRAQTVAPRTVVVVDSGSSDGSVETARNHGAEVIQLASNKGFAAAVNAGLRAVGSSLVAVLNNDVELPPNWVGTLAQALNSAQYADSFFAVGKIYQAARPGYLDGSFDLLSRGACAWRAGHDRPDGCLWDKPRRIFLFPWTAVLFRREIFDHAGFLDERFESYLEDVDFGIRCALRGLAGVYFPKAVCRHWGSGTLGVWHPDTIRHISRNQLFLVAKYFRVGDGAAPIWPILVAQLLWGGLALRHGCLLAYLRGKLEGLRRFGEISRHSQGGSNLMDILDENETLLRDLQSQSGYDLFWRLYFSLT